MERVYTIKLPTQKIHLAMYIKIFLHENSKYGYRTFMIKSVISLLYINLVSFKYFIKAKSMLKSLDSHDFAIFSKYFTYT